MVDVAKLTNDLYEPLFRYHVSKGTTTLGVKTPKPSALADAGLLGGQLIDKENILKLMQSLSGQNETQTRILSDAIIAKWKDEKNGGAKFLERLDSDLGKDPAAAARLVEAIKRDPNKVAANLNGMSQYTSGSLNALIPAVVTPTPDPLKVAPPPAQAAGAPAQPKPGTVASKPPKPAPTAVDTARPSIAAAAASITALPQEAGTPDQPQLATSAAPDATVATAAPEPLSAADLQKISRDVFESLADANDEKISKVLTKDMVRTILTSMSQDAITKFGVSAQDANGFKETINDPDNDALLDRITKNFQRNPEFIRQLARASKDSGEPLSDMKKNAARAMMTPIMENPQNLAEDAYVKEMTGKLKMGNSKSPLMDMFAGMFGGMGGWLGEIFSKVQQFFSGFFGDKKVFSVVNQGGSMLPTLMVNTRAIEENRVAAYAASTVSARDMTALSLDGKRFITVKEKGPDGKEVEKQVPNTIEITTTDGKKVKAVPSVGVLLAQQAKGDFDPDTGRFIPGPVSAWIVTGLDENGASASVKRVTMSEAEFLKYKKQVDDTSEKYGNGRKLAFEPYTEQDARRAGIVPRLQVASVNPQTGAVTDTLLRPAVQQPAAPASSGPKSYPVRPGTTDDVSDPELALR